MPSNKLITELFKHGLGDLHILHAYQEKIYFGKMQFEKSRLVIKDNKLLTDFKVEQLKPCWESGYLGLVCFEKGYTWESLSFYGIEECDLPVDLSQTRHGALLAAENQYGDKLVDFVGSVYRGYQLMLDNHFLPVVLMKEAKTRNGTPGLIISDLMVCPMDIALLRGIFDEIHKSVERYLILTVDDVQMNQDDFEDMFGDYLK
jgi:hypothetical protein